ncbi:kinase-like domain-containing protein [Pavlovales sp. CCMP2436]|nr:kinase-like domain-containing protein [Pavlovales sp. CCMP2436]|mmetsp:Transcript_368/g.1053  ORF Transcript_368/g.1053 Transcript_368/m.1053 type:complete len:565 (-) Transcript_368:95-1789(-)
METDGPCGVRGAHPGRNWTASRLEADFVRGRMIGRGRYGQAILWTARGHDAHGLDSEHGGPAAVVVKQVALEALNEKERQQTANEVELLSALLHPNVIGYLGAFVEGPTNTMNLVLEYADGGTLADRIKQSANRQQTLDPIFVQHWFRQIALAVDHVHVNRVLHRDLKSANVFLTAAHDVKLGDFGVSRQLSETLSLAQTICGTPYYLAPELVRGLEYSRPADIWAIGCVLYEMITLRRPFSGENLGELVLNITQGRFTGDGDEGAPSLLDACTDDVELRALVMGCLVPEPTQRLTMAQILASRYVRTAVENVSALAEATRPLPSALPSTALPSGRAVVPPSAASPASSHASASTRSSSSASQPATLAIATALPPALDVPVRERRTLTREQSQQSDSSSLLSPDSHKSVPSPPALSSFGGFGLARNSSSDLLHFRDSVSDAARRARRRRGAIGSPLTRVHPGLARGASSGGVPLSHLLHSPTVTHHSYGTASDGSAQRNGSHQTLAPCRTVSCPHSLGALSQGADGKASALGPLVPPPPLAIRTRSATIKEILTPDRASSQFTV